MSPEGIFSSGGVCRPFGVLAGGERGGGSNGEPDDVRGWRKGRWSRVSPCRHRCFPPVVTVIREWWGRTDINCITGEMEEGGEA